MNPVWAPARFRYSCFKLIAFFVAPRSRPPATPRLLIFEKDQHVLGVLAAAIFAITVFSLFVFSWTAWMFTHGGWLWSVAAVALVIVATSNFSLIVTPLFFVAELFVGQDVSGTDRGVKFVSGTVFTAACILSIVTIARELPGFAAAIVCLTGVTINFVAAVLVHVVLRAPIARLDASLKEASKFDL